MKCNAEHIIKALTETKYKNSEQLANKLLIYANELINWNSKFNLTSIKEGMEVALKHIADSIIPLSNGVFERINQLADCGTGAGLPGIPLALAESNLKISLIESNGKKIKFLRHIKKLLDINNINIIQSRTEVISHSKEFRNFFDGVTMRAFANFSSAMELTAELVKPGGKIFYYASKNQAENINGTEKILNEMKLSELNKFYYNLPDMAGSRAVIILTKTNKADIKYPRPYQKIKSNPLI